MLQTPDLLARRTTTDVVFEKLQGDIVSLKLLPGTKLSEAEIARSFDVSRQPVRDAFNRLANLDLLLIRPQKATKVRGFSEERIAHARFVRLAVELEALRGACAVWDERRAEILEQNLNEQEQAIESGKPDDFQALDYSFHKLIFELGGYPLACETLKECKQKVDRLCALGLGRQREAKILLDDHRKIARALRGRSADAACAAAREHLGRLDTVIAQIRSKHLDYFE